MLTLICPKCGKEKSKDSFYGNVCLECYLEDKDFVDLKTKELKMCKSCGRIFYKNKWQAFSEDDLKEIIEENLKVDFPEYEIKNVEISFYKDKIKADVTLKSKLDKHQIVTKKEFIIDLKMQNCDDCYRTMSDYYQAVIQIRYKPEELEKYKETLKGKKLGEFMLDKMKEVIKEQRKKGNFLAYVYKIENTKNGFDIYVGSKMQAIEFLKLLKNFFLYERKESTSLVGIDKKGKEKLRYTYLVRLKPY